MQYIGRMHSIKCMMICNFWPDLDMHTNLMVYKWLPRICEILCELQITIYTRCEQCIIDLICANVAFGFDSHIHTHWPYFKFRLMKFNLADGQMIEFQCNFISFVSVSWSLCKAVAIWWCNCAISRLNAQLLCILLLLRRWSQRYIEAPSQQQQITKTASNRDRQNNSSFQLIFMRQWVINLFAPNILSAICLLFFWSIRYWPLKCIVKNTYLCIIIPFEIISIFGGLVFYSFKHLI